MPGKKQVRLAFCDLAPDWDARDNYFTQALEHAGWEITFCNGPEEKPDFVPVSYTHLTLPTIA